MEEYPQSKDGDEERQSSVFLLPPFLREVISGLPPVGRVPEGDTLMPQIVVVEMVVPMDLQRLSDRAAAKQGEIKNLYFGLRHDELSHNQATISFCSFSPKSLNRVLMRFISTPQAPVRQGGNT